MNSIITKHFKDVNILAIATACFLMWLTIQNVDVRWGQAEVTLLWSLPILSFIALGVCAIYIKQDLKFSILDLLILLWAVYYFLRVFIGKEFPCGTQFSKEMGIFMLYFALRPIMMYRKVSPILIICLILIGGYYETLLGVSQIIQGSGRHYLYQLTGTFLNPGPYSAYILMALIVGLTAKEHIFKLIRKFPKTSHKYIEYVYLFIMFMIAMVLFSTWSRAAIISFFCVVLYVYRHYYWKYRYFVWLAICTCCVALYFIKQGSADGRMLTWAASLTSWMHSPWLGVGIGGFRNACAEGLAELYIANTENSLFATGDVAEYAFCDFIKIFVEQGVLGGLFCITCVILTLYYIHRWSTPLFYTLLSLIVFSLFSYPFEMCPYRIIVVLLAATVPHKVSVLPINNVFRKCLVILFYFVVSISAFFIAKESQYRFQIHNEAKLFSGIQHAAFINDYYELLPTESDDPQYLFDFAKTLRNEGRFKDSNALLQQGTLVSNDPMFYVLQGNNYKDMKCYSSAEKTYKKAHAVMPNRIYPLYQLMIMYEDIGLKEKSKNIAKKITGTKAKIESPATRDMRKKASLIISNI